MTYTYPTIQTVYQDDTVFVMFEHYADTLYNEYEITYRRRGTVLSGCITRAAVKELIKQGLTKVQCLSSFAHGQPFIKIPLKYITHATRNMEPTKTISDSLF